MSSLDPLRSAQTSLATVERHRKTLAEAVRRLLAAQEARQGEQVAAWRQEVRRLSRNLLDARRRARARLEQHHGAQQQDLGL